MSHVPVMAGEVLRNIDAAPGQRLVDLTVGAGGHAAAFLRATAPTGVVVGCDRDRDALQLAEANLLPFGDRVTFRHGDSVTCLRALLAAGEVVDAILLDLGVSSMQLDEIDRGFTLREDAPLDMRMDQSEGRTAADVVNTLPESELASVLRELGDEPRADRIARALVARRQRRPFRSTGDLRDVVEQALHRRGGRINPATRTFQALRMVVNRERELLLETLPLALRVLRPGGHLAVIAFHSGEDRIVKTTLREAALSGVGELVTRRPLSPEREEQRTNRRSRSARLRVIRKADAS